MRLFRSVRPLDGWRRFFGEVGIIILGVLVALGLGAIATEIGWRREVATSRDALAYEIGTGVGQGQLHVAKAPCVERRLDELGRIVMDAERTGRLPPVGSIELPGWHTWDSGVWESAVAAQTANHFPRDEAQGIVVFYGFVDILRENEERILELWTRFSALSGPGRPFTSAEARSLMNDLSLARLLYRQSALAAVRAEQSVDLYDLTYDRPTAASYVDRPLAMFPVCKPIPKDVPASYEQAPFKNIVERARANPLTLPEATAR
ncbi:hypothetical protein H8M03_04070 [Sphingomonas sabuli]|uniref:Uncharacterized protein n=1 Tax=Sphingomonas sabuli TaxID=2764186 RepID=A0A7G9L4G8_9SPHN|nr:hypothetical protein [Sphingomonas sabuli]QNM83517.1 hypothetical protein H8M03_04070 [Sphingomonas sabuli]